MKNMKMSFWLISFQLMIIMLTEENYNKVNAGHAPMKTINYKTKNQIPENLFPPLLYLPVKESIKWNNNYHTSNYKANQYSYQDDLNMPTCGQLRALWHSSIKQLRENFETKLLENDLPKIFDNPIYLSLLLWQQQQLLKHEQEQQQQKQQRLHEQQNHYLNQQNNGDNRFESDHPFYKGMHSNGEDDDGVFGRIIYNPNEMSQSNHHNDNNKNNNNNHNSLNIQYNRNSDENSLNKDKNNAKSKTEKLIFGKIITHKDTKDSTRKSNNNHDENSNKKNNHYTNTNNNNYNIDKNRRMNAKFFEDKFNNGERQQKQNNLLLNDDDNNGDESTEYGEEAITSDQQSSGKNNGHLNSDEFFGSTWLDGPVTPNI